MCNHDTYQSNPAKPEIIHNRGRCKLCGDIIESTDRHEFVTCRWLYRGKENGGFILHAENKTYRGEELDRHVKNVSVQGIVLRVLKELK